MARGFAALTWACLLGVALGMPAQSGAAEPEWTRIMPPGCQRGQSVVVEVTGKFDAGKTRVWCDRPGVHWKAIEGDTPRFEVSVDAEVEPGVCWVRLVGTQGVSKLRPFIVGHVTERRETEPNDRPTQAEAVSTDPVVIHGVLERSGDVDGYLVTVPRGRTLVASVMAERGLGAPVDATLQVVSRDGHVLAENLDYHGLDPLVTWRASGHEEGDGDVDTVVVRVFGYPATPNSTIGLAGAADYQYRLTLTTGPFLEGTLPLGVSQAAVTPMRPVGWNWPVTGDSPLLKMGDAASGEAAKDELAVYRETVAGWVNLPVVDVPTLSWQADADGATDTMTIPVPSMVSGELGEAGIKHRFEWEAAAKSRWRINVESRSLGYPLDPVLEIENARDGKSLLRVDDSNGTADPSVVWEVPETGRYRVTVSDVNGHGGPHWLYRLRLEPEVPDCRLTVKEDVIRGRVGEPIEIPIAIARTAGFAEPLTIAADALPDGVQLEPVVSSPEGDTKQAVKLVLTADRALCEPLRLRAKGTEGVSLPVRQGERLDVLWLVVEGPAEKEQSVQGEQAGEAGASS